MRRRSRRMKLICVLLSIYLCFQGASTLPITAELLSSIPLANPTTATASSSLLHVTNAIYESEPVGSEAADLDQLLYGSIYGLGQRSFQLIESKLNVNGNGAAKILEEDLFALGGSKLAVATLIDREQLCGRAANCVIETSVFVSQKEPKEMDFILVLETTIRDINDNEPRFVGVANKPFQLLISESDRPGSRFRLPKAIDLDSDDFGLKEYRLEGGATTFFELLPLQSNLDDPVLEMKESLDRETTPRLNLKLIAFDRGSPPLSMTLPIEVVVQDENDNSPVFDKREYVESLQESFDVGGVVSNVQASDRDDGDNARLSYIVDDSASPPSERGLFAIPNPLIGQIRLAKPLDYEQWQSHSLKVLAVDHGRVQRTGTTMVTINVIDVNDQPPAMAIYPTIPNDKNQVVVSENRPVGVPVALIRIKEPEGNGRDPNRLSAFRPSNSEVDCTILRQDLAKGFVLFTKEKGSEYILKTNSSLDREKTPKVLVQVQCYTRLEGGSRLATSRDVIVHVLDENDNAPAFDGGATISMVATVRENQPPGARVILLNAVDPDEGPNGVVSYEIFSDGVAAPFSVHPTMGVVLTTEELDRESKESYTIKILARDSGLPHRQVSVLTLTIKVDDVNDNSPAFEKSVYNFLIPANPDAIQLPYRITQFSTTDADDGPNGQVTVELEEGSPDFFEVDSSGGLVLTNPIPKAWTESTFNGRRPIDLKVIATDGGAIRRQTSALVKLRLVSPSDSSLLVLFPSKTNSTLKIPIGTLKLAMNSFHDVPLGIVEALTDDNYVSQGAYLNFELLNAPNTEARSTNPIMFKISRTTGEIYVDRDSTGMSVTNSNIEAQVGDRYGLAVVIRLNLPAFNRTDSGSNTMFAIERFARLEVQVVESDELRSSSPPTDAAASSSTFEELGFVLTVSSISGFLVTFLIFGLVLIRRRVNKSTSSARRPNSMFSGSASGVSSASKSSRAQPPSSASPCSSSEADTKPLSVNIGKTATKPSGFENSLSFPVDRIRLDVQDQQQQSQGLLVGVISPHMTVASTTVAVSNEVYDNVAGLGGFNKTSSKDSTSSSVSTTAQDHDSGRGSDELAGKSSTSSGTDRVFVPISILKAKHDAQPLHQQTCERYRVSGARSMQREMNPIAAAALLAQQLTSTTASTSSTSAVGTSNSNTSPSNSECNSDQVFALMPNQYDADTSPVYRTPPHSNSLRRHQGEQSSSHHDCPVHGVPTAPQSKPPPRRQCPQPPQRRYRSDQAPIPPLRSCPVHGVVIPVGPTANNPAIPEDLSVYPPNHHLRSYADPRHHPTSTKL